MRVKKIFSSFMALIILVLFNAHIAIASDKSKDPIYIGFLEELTDTSETTPPNLINKQSYLPYIRNTFEKNGEEWCSTRPDDTCGNGKIEIPPNLEWIVTFDGKQIGHIKSQDAFSSNFDNMVNTYRVDLKNTIPHVGKRTREYGGWMGEPVHRPLVLVSEPHYSDPDHWKPYKPNSKEIRLLIPHFRASVDHVTLCDRSENIVNDHYQYTNSQVHLSKGYRSNKGTRLISLILDNALSHCGVSGPEFDPVWFYIDKSGHINRLTAPHINTGSYTSLTLLDAGDYDNDGKSEVIFAMGSYNEDGYVLFYNDFKNSTVFSWTYH